MNCSRCNSTRILYLSARAKDMHNYKFGTEEVFGSYACDFSCDGDTTELDICMECGQVQGYTWPLQSILFEPGPLCEGCENPEDECTCP